MNTYDILSRIRAFVASLEASGGEADDTTDQAMSELLDQAEDKAGALVYTLARLDLEAQGEKDIEATAKRRRAAAERAHGRVRALLLDLLQGHLALTGEAKAKTPYGTAYLVHSTRVDGPESAEEWPEQYREAVTTVRARRAEALADLRKGAQVPPLSLAETVSVGVRK